MKGCINVIMIAIYDFDGTLTPFSLPQYQILKQFGYNDDSLEDRRKKEENSSLDFYETYYKVYRDILLENRVEFSRKNVCLGATEVKFNPGVLNYFKKYQSSITGIKHYIVTSGIKDYVDECPIVGFVDGVYGVEFKNENGIFKQIEKLVTDKKKVDVIRKIRMQNEDTTDIVYFGDGMTDMKAFEYVHELGGINVFVVTKSSSKSNYLKINQDGIIDECFIGDFRENSKINKFMGKILIKSRNKKEIMINDEER